MNWTILSIGYNRSRPGMWLPWCITLVFAAAFGCRERTEPAPKPSEPSSPTPAAPTQQSPPASGQPKVDYALQGVGNELDLRRQEQERAAAGSPVSRQFSFTDVFPQSGIRFEHHVVEDAGKHYKALHYDHGNGLVAGDVDGDGKLDLYFTSQIGGNELWRNLGQGKFEDITETAGVGLADRVSVAAALADIDNDGDLDLFVTTVRMGNALFENLGSGKFRDISKDAGVDYVGHSSGAVFLDYDRDGRLDLFVANVGIYTTDQKGTGGYYIGYKDAFSGHTKPERTEPSLLYRNLGNRKFQETSRATGLIDNGWSGDASACDLDEDLFPDLYVLNMQGDDHFYANRMGKRFEETTAQHFPKTPWGCMGIKFFDFNLDQKPDVILTDMHSDMTDTQTKTSKGSLELTFEKAKSEAWCVAQFTEQYLQGASNNIFGNALYINQGAGPFQEMSDALGAETFWPWGVTVGDLNADGYEDVFVTAGMGFGFRYAINSVLLNDRGQGFVDAEFLLGVEPRLGGRTMKPAFVLDCGGADKNHPLCRGRSDRVTVNEALSSRSAVIADLDDDGDLDIVTNEQNDRPMILLSNLAGKETIHYLKIKLVGSASNRDGLGAWVDVRAGGKIHHRYCDGKAGYFSHSPLPLYFGLGVAEAVEEVSVLWPSGKKQTLTSGIPIHALLTITEPEE